MLTSLQEDFGKYRGRDQVKRDSNRFARGEIHLSSRPGLSDKYRGSLGHNEYKETQEEPFAGPEER
jgi:hypothetical protein